MRRKKIQKRYEVAYMTISFTLPPPSLSKPIAFLTFFISDIDRFMMINDRQFQSSLSTVLRDLKHIFAAAAAAVADIVDAAEYCRVIRLVLNSVHSTTVISIKFHTMSDVALIWLAITLY